MKISTCTNNQKIYFGGITHILKNSPGLSEDFICKNIPETYAKPIGRIPNEFIRILKKNKPNEFKRGIQDILNVFEEAYPICTKLENYIQKHINDFYKNLEPDEYFTFALKQIKAVAMGQDHLNHEFLCKNTKLDQNIINQILNELTNLFRKNFTEAKIISPKDSLKVELIDWGAFSTAYKVSCQDSANNKIFSEKVLKFYRDRKQYKETGLSIEKAHYRIIKQYPKQVNNLLNYLIENYVNTGKIQKNLFEKVILQKINNIINSQSENEFIVLFINAKQDIETSRLNKIHGIFQEANSGLYILKNIGKPARQMDVVDFYIADLKNRCALYEYADPNLAQKQISKCTYSTLGLQNNDIQINGHIKNFVAGKLVDYGGFYISNKILVNSKIVRRYYKKIYNVNKTGAQKIEERIRLLNYYYDLATKNKISHKNEVIIALIEAKKLIPTEFTEKINF